MKLYPEHSTSIHMSYNKVPVLILLPFSVLFQCTQCLSLSMVIGDIIDVLATLHWLRLPERVDFKTAVMAYRVLHGLAPSYLSQLIRTADLPGRRRLRSSSTHSLLVPSFRHSTVDRRSFPVAASVLWNSLPLDIQSSPSLTVSVNGLKLFYFVNRYPTFYCSYSVHAFVVSVIVSI